MSLQTQIEARKAAFGRKGLRRKPPKMLFPWGIERQYTAFLLSITAKIKEKIELELLPSLEKWEFEATVLKPRADSYVEDIEVVIAALRISLGAEIGNVEAAALNVGELISQFNTQELNKIFQATLGVNPLISEPWLRNELASFAKQNATLIKSIPQNYLNEVEGIVQRGYASGRRANEIAAEIQERFNVTENRAKLIARDQTAKLNGNLTKLRQQELQIDSYIWRTSEDGRVRPSHEENNGKVFKWSEPPATGHAGEDYSCRCYAEPILDKFYEN